MATPRPYDPVEEAAAAMGVANLRPRYFITGSPDATVALNARYGQAVKQASDLGFDIARRPLQLEQERLQTEAAGMAVENQRVGYERVQNALRNRDRIESVLAGIDPTASDYRARRVELAKLGADEILGEELTQLDEQAKPYERVRSELTERDELDKQLAPKREGLFKSLNELDTNDPDFRKKVFGKIAENPWVMQDPLAYRALEDYSRSALEKEQARKLRERELIQLDPDTRKLYDEQVKTGLDPDNALFAATRARQAKLLKLDAIRLGFNPKELATIGDDPDQLSRAIAIREGQMAQRKQSRYDTRARQSLIKDQIRALKDDLESGDPAKVDAAKAKKDALTNELLDLPDDVDEADALEREVESGLNIAR